MKSRAQTSHDTTSTLQVSDADLQQYAKGELHAARRSQIEGFLACNPDLAARVMQAMHRRERARSIGLPLSWVRRVRIGTVVLCLACGVTGWAVAEGLDDDGPFRDLQSTPEYVEDAMMSQRVTHVRIGMASQVETPHLDSQEIESATSIRIPVLPQTWRLLDAQIYPSEEGPSVSVLMETAGGQRVNLFAVRADTAAGGSPELAREKGAYAAYWESGGAAYVVTGDGAPADLLDRATELSRNALM